MNLSSFQQGKAWALENSPWWDRYYLKAFPGIKTILPVEAPCELQDRGVDKIVDFRRGQRLYFEDKLRQRRKPVDVALEYRHVPVNPDEAPWDGWIEKTDQLTDVFCYGFINYNAVFFIPWRLLQGWYFENHSRLHAQFETIKAPNPKPPLPPRYFGWSLVIPRAYLFAQVEGIVPIEL
jgi:hypothetical protein